MEKEYKKIIFVLCGLSASSIGLCNNAVGVFYQEVSTYLHVLKGTFAFHATLSLMATAITSLFIPAIIHKNNYKQYMRAGIIMTILSTLCMSISNHILLFYILGIIRGISTAFFAIVPITMIINQWFEQRKGFATSIVLSFSGLSGALCSPLLTYFIDHYSFQTGYIIQAVCLLIFCLPALIINFHIDPKEIDLLPYGYTNIKQTINTLPFNYKQLSFLIFCLMTICHTSITGISQHMPIMASSIQLSAVFGSYMMSLAMLGNISTKLLIGILSDYLKPVKACMIMIYLHMFSLLCLFMGLNLCNQYLLIIGAFLFGSIYSVGAVGIPLLTQHFFKKEYYGKAYRIIGFLTNLGSSLSLTLIGYLYDYSQSYTYVFIIAALFHIMNLCIIRYLNTKNAS